MVWLPYDPMKLLTYIRYNNWSGSKTKVPSGHMRLWFLPKISKLQAKYKPKYLTHLICCHQSPRPANKYEMEWDRLIPSARILQLIERIAPCSNTHRTNSNRMKRVHHLLRHAYIDLITDNDAMSRRTIGGGFVVWNDRNHKMNDVTLYVLSLSSAFPSMLHYPRCYNGCNVN